MTIDVRPYVKQVGYRLSRLKSKRLNPEAVMASREPSDQPFTSQVSSRVIKLLQEYDTPLSTRDIAELLGKPPGHIHGLLLTLLSQGIIRSPGRTPARLGERRMRLWELKK